ncbi:hypothetical protein [Brevibacterium yomogidense]|uniref:hypothetical protein n=1 Tax=Brevibacterium yomogidense TaxID=946573 RepID=UPI0018E05A0A|nr:hypothetical protein [Brevibacterium yomogidense]
MFAVVFLLALSGCSVPEQDTRPRSDRATLIEKLRELPGVVDVEDPPDAEGPQDVHDPQDAQDPAHGDDTHDGADPYAGEASEGDEPIVAVLDTDPDEADLRTAGSRLHRLVTGHRYPGGTPAVIVRSGDFTASPAALTGRRDPTASYPTDSRAARLDLTELLDLKALPAVASGTVTESRAHVVLLDDTGPRAWMDEALETSAHLGLDVFASDDPDASPVYSVEMGTSASAEAVTSLHAVLDSASARVIEFRVAPGIQHPHGELAVEDPDGLIALQEELDATFGSDALQGFSATTNTGTAVNLTVQGSSIEDQVDAVALLGDAGVAVTHVTGGGTAVHATADDGGTLRAVADALAHDSWPLAPDTEVHVEHEDSPVYASTFDASEWADHVEVPAALWDAGFTSVRCILGPGAASQDTTDLIIEIGRQTAPDYTTAPGRDALIQTLRDVGWDGTANIVLDSGDLPSFTSTANGPAEDVSDASGVADAPRSGWSKEFIEGWDATAS